MKKIISMTVGVLMLTALNVSALDFGDHSSSTLASKAWDALGQQKYDDALSYIAKCVELYGAKAKEMQLALKAKPTDKAVTEKQWALNDVGTCMFIKGEVLMKKGDKKGAIAAYKDLVKNYKYAQCWDPKGWFWSPADAAKKKIVELEFDDE